MPGDGTLRLFRGTKFRFADIEPAIIERAMRPGHHLTARYRMTDANGNPACASIRPPRVTFSVEPG